MIRHTFFFDQVWQLPSSQLSTDTSACLDHRCIIVYFTKHLLLGHLPTHRVKQKGEWRTVFNLKQCKQKEWDEFRKQVDERLQYNMANSAAPSKSTLPANKKSLNYKWQIFKDSVLQAAKASLKIKKRGPYTDNDTPDKLIMMRKHLTSLNKIFAFITALVYPKALHNKFTTTIAQHQRIWLGNSKKLGLINMYKDITMEFPFHIDNDEIPTIISTNTLPSFKVFRLKVAALRNLVRMQRSFLETSYNNELIKEYEKTRCANYVADKAAFIASSLNKSKRSIVLDRAMNTHNTNEHTLETESVRVKELANEHFKTIAGIPPLTPPTIHDMSDRWQPAYLPSDEIDPTIYKDLLAPPTDEEWKETINNLPNNKAAGLSGIPYDLIKQLSEEASLYLKLLITECFDSEEIPSHWKDATIYPIPKPYDWNCYLSNTRPITLLDTARKLMTRIMNKRLGSILAANNILKGNNYAGLPGSNCSTPIAILESILPDAKSHNKPLFIFLQDISKAFDSMDIRMLQLAMQRLKIPTGFIKLVSTLFTDRYNTVITAYGHSAPYKTEIGIDQGETLSPLLWVIYIDPLLTVLNKEAFAPYVIDSDPLASRVSTSTLAFMDDTTLRSSSREDLLHPVDIALEF